ncbi:MAG: hypothetical protein K8T90_03990 [Planctomycetes bacterium]|nr:hypothetical protein [Planctomycetota bacterium]
MIHTTTAPAARTPRSRRADFAIWAAIFVPATAVWIWKALVLPRGWWVGFYDPELLYFWSSGEIASGHAASVVQHPGAPVNLIGAVIALFTGSGPRDATAFFSVAHTVSWLALLATAWMALRTILRGLPAVVAGAAILCALCAPWALFATTMWSPEALSVPTGFLGAVAFAAWIESPDNGRRALAAGAAAGLAASLKLPFGAWCIAAVPAALVLRGGSIRLAARDLFRIGVGAAAAFMLATLVMLPQWAYMFTWFTRLATRSGPYGSGESGIVASEVSTNLSRVIAATTTWHAAAALLFVPALMSWPRDGAAPDARRRRAVLVLAVAAFGLGYGAVSRNALPRYMLPQVMPLILAASQAGYVLRSRRWAAGGLALVAVALFVRQSALDIREHRWWVETLSGQAARMRETVARVAPSRDGRPAVVVWARRAPVEVLALGWFAPERHIGTVHELYPNEGWFDPYACVVHLPPGREAWDVLVIQDFDLARFPTPVGTELAVLDGYHFYGPPSR